MARFREGVQCSIVGTACESETTLALRGCETQRGCVVGKQNKPNSAIPDLFTQRGKLVIACEWWLCSFVQTVTSALLGTTGNCSRTKPKMTAICRASAWRWVPVENPADWLVD